TQRARQRDDRAHDRRAATATARHQLGDEGTVDLQRMQLETVQVTERRIAGTEIVERGHYAGLAQTVEDFADLLGIVHQRAFGHFDPNLAGIDSRRAQKFEQARVQVGRAKVQRRKIEVYVFAGAKQLRD